MGLEKTGDAGKGSYVKGEEKEQDEPSRMTKGT